MSLESIWSVYERCLLSPTALDTILSVESGVKKWNFQLKFDPFALLEANAGHTFIGVSISSFLASILRYGRT